MTSAFRRGSRSKKKKKEREKARPAGELDPIFIQCTHSYLLCMRAWALGTINKLQHRQKMESNDNFFSDTPSPLKWKVPVPCDKYAYTQPPTPRPFGIIFHFLATLNFIYSPLFWNSGHENRWLLSTQYQTGQKG